MSPLLEMRGITKRFPGVTALDGVDFELEKGEVHVILGENGAGKSTLIKMLSGAYHPDEGEILLDGQRVEIPPPLTPSLKVSPPSTRSSTWSRSSPWPRTSSSDASPPVRDRGSQPDERRGARAPGADKGARGPG